MKVIPTEIEGVMLIEPKVFGDSRGFFFESYNQRAFNEAVGIDASFVQDNHSRSQKGVLRGLHYQVKNAQGKLVRVVRGTVFDVVVDLRRDSPTFGKWAGFTLDDSDHRQIWIPPGIAHGFLVLSDSADFLYKTTDYYMPEHERCIAWNDAQIGVEWPLTEAPTLSAKDQLGLSLADAVAKRELP